MNIKNNVEIIFNTVVDDLIIENNVVKGVILETGEKMTVKELMKGITI